MNNKPRCPRCGSSNTRKSDDRLLKGGLAHLGEFAVGFGLGWLGMEDVVKDNPNEFDFTQYIDDEFQCNNCGCVWKPNEVYQGTYNDSQQLPQTTISKQTHQIAQDYDNDDFAHDWDDFFDNLEDIIKNRKSVEHSFDTYEQKAKYNEYSNANSAACYHYMAAILCYLFYSSDTISESGQTWACKQGRKAMRAAKRIIPDDLEFSVMTAIYDIIKVREELTENSNIQDCWSNLKIIKKDCPNIAHINNPMIKNEALQTWFDNAYNDYVFWTLILCSKQFDENPEMKIKFAKKIEHSKIAVEQLIAVASLADGNFDMGDIVEAKRYSKIGKEMANDIDKYDADIPWHFYWGMCWSIFSQCQEKDGHHSEAKSLVEQGAKIGIPWCVKKMSEYNINTSISLPNASVETRTAIVEESSIGNEQEYLKMLKESLEDGDISDRERRLLDRIRISLGIDEKRAKELEDSLNKQFTKEEQDYLEAFKDACENGIVSDKQRRLLEKLRVMYGISEERAREIENMN